MKKRVVFLFAAVFIALSCAVFQASAWDDDFDYDFYTNYYYDCDGDSLEETVFNITYDTESMTACIRGFNSPLNHIVIPETVSVGLYDDYYYDYNVYDFTVTAIYGTDTEYYSSEITSVEVPYTVEEIAPKTLGYYYDYDENYDEVLLPVEGFKIYCTENTAAHTYATENGFDCELFKNISDADIRLEGAPYVYSGLAVTPEAAVFAGDEALKTGIDYTLEYSDNINAGAARVSITGIGKYRGRARLNFTIEALPVSGARLTLAAQCVYTGSALRPAISVSLGDRLLAAGTDYRVTYSRNVEPGTAYAEVSFCGNYSGNASASFKIVLGNIAVFKSSATTSNSIKLIWTNVKCDEFFLYKYDNASKKYVLFKRLSENTYTETGLSQFTSHYYRVGAVKRVSNGTTVYGAVSSLKCVTKLTTPTIRLATYDKAAKVSWVRNAKATGYQVYRCDWFAEFKRIKAVTDKTVGSYRNTGLNNDNNYFYKVRSYRTVNGATYYSDFSDVKATLDTTSILEAASLKSRRSFKVYNTQGSTSTSWTYYLNDNDIKILKSFISSHFATGMSREDKLRITLNWINRNITYATGSDWDKISGKSWVEAIFTYRLGQCAQYNGAMAAMMAYLGYDAYVIQGYRGTWPSRYWQHFWCEVNIGGRIYVMETGNYDCDGPWSYFLAPYSETRRYIKNKKNM